MADSFTIKSRHVELDSVLLSTFMRGSNATLDITWTERTFMENGEAGESNLPEGYGGTLQISGVIKGTNPSAIWHNNLLLKSGDEVPFLIQPDADRAAVAGVGDAAAPVYTGYVSVASVGNTNGEGVTYWALDFTWKTSRSIYYDVGAGPVLLEGPPAL